MVTGSKNKLLDEWAAFCSGISEYDKAHFSTILMDELDDAQIIRFFALLPHADEMRERCHRVKSTSRNMNRRQDETFGEAHLKSIGISLHAGLAALIETAGDLKLSREMQHLPIDVVDTAAVRAVASNEDSLHFEVYEIIGDELSNRFRDAHPTGFVLQEALYGMHNDYYLAWFCAAPMLGIGSALDAYFDLWAIGGSFAVGDARFMISCG